MPLHPSLRPCDLSPNITYSCLNKYPDCHNLDLFDFPSLWLITQILYNACPNDTRLFQQTPQLTQKSCENFVGGDHWKPYPAADIWSRLTTWKFPLFNLLAVFPKPPLSFVLQLFVLVQVMGDPISAISNLLLKAASCQSRARFWKDQLSNRERLGYIIDNHEGRKERVSQTWKGFSAIIDSYDEWGQEVGNDAEDFIASRLSRVEIPLEDKKRFLELCQNTANALAADRATNFFPVIVAQFLFIGTIGISIGRTKDSATSTGPIFINVEAYSIAFSALYFYLIPLAFLGSVIGVSQTENAIPRILKGFANEVQNEFPWWDCTSLTKPWNTTPELQRKGGLYSWQCQKERRAMQNNILNRYQTGRERPTTPLQYLKEFITHPLGLYPGSITLSFVILTYCAITGIIIAYLVPPKGFECRHLGLLLIYLAWILSYSLNLVPFPSHHPKTHFNLLLVKNIVSTCATMGGIVVTQVGVFNRCSCYTLWGKTGLALPERDSVMMLLMQRIGRVYPALAFLCVGFQLVVVMGIVVVEYEGAMQVFLQKDDGGSHGRWVVWVRGVPGGVWRVLRWVGRKVRGAWREANVGRRRGGGRYEPTNSLTHLASASPSESKHMP